MGSEPECLEQVLSAEFRGVAETWHLSEMDEGVREKLLSAVASVRSDHDAKPVVEKPPHWYLQPYWNEETDEVRIAAYVFDSSYVIETGQEGGDE